MYEKDHIPIYKHMGLNKATAHSRENILIIQLTRWKTQTE